MVFNKKKNAQAAIEFLMTYGWMLLVVLIVGALIFSFVDFGSLLPNKLELNNNLRGMATESFATAGTAQEAFVVFTYTGAQRGEIVADSDTIQISTTTGDTCNAAEVFNSETDANQTASSGGTGTVSFLNGQIGYVTFDCSTINGGQGMISGDTLEGDVTIPVRNLQTGLNVPSSGPIRLVVND